MQTFEQECRDMDEQDKKQKVLIEVEGYSQKERNEVIEKILTERKKNWERNGRIFVSQYNNIDSYEFKIITMKGLLKLLSHGGVRQAGHSYM